MSARSRFLSAVLVSTAVLGACDDQSIVQTASPVDPQQARWSARTVGQVQDLSVESSTSSSLVMSFTEVSDDKGAAADYELRFAPSPMGWGWGQATVVAQGTCASPAKGTKAGATHTCTIEGLEANKAYDVQLVAFRSGNARVYGSLSNVASGTTVQTVVVTDPGEVTDLSVKSTAATAVTLGFTQVSDGAGDAADYRVRYAANPIGWGWGSATMVDAGTCASASGTAVGQPLECTVAGLTSGKKYDFQLVAYRGTPNQDAAYGKLSNVATGTPAGAVVDDGSTKPDTTSTDPNTGGDVGGGNGGQPVSGECASASSAWVFCDDFEQDRLSSYFEYAPANNSFVRASSVGVGGSTGMRARFSAGQVDAGSLKLAFGRTPQSRFKPVDAGTKDYREIYWRVYVRNEPNWTGGGGNKLTRATIFSSSSTWAQAMIAHVWTATSGPNWNYLSQDPAAGTNSSGSVVTSKYNDFPNLRWLGATRGNTALFTGSSIGEWHCVETHVKVNDPGQSNSIMEVWVDGQLDSRKANFNWVGNYSAYGLNAIMLENYWNGGSPKSQERYMDNFVVSTQRIGC